MMEGGGGCGGSSNVHREFVRQLGDSLGQTYGIPVSMTVQWVISLHYR